MELNMEKDHDDWVVPNSDVLYKKDIKWAEPRAPVQPSKNELEMLDGTLNPKELIKREREESLIEKTPEEIKKQKTKEMMNMFKVITMDQMGYSPLNDFRDLNVKEQSEYMSLMKERVKEYSDGKEEEIRERFNKICIDKLFHRTADITRYCVGR